MIYDLAIIGLGGMGSATAAEAARRGLSVVGLEQFEPAHAMGASHGRTRLIRTAYFEGPAYVPLLRRAYELWDRLEAQSGSVLRSRTGALYVGDEQTALIAGTLASAQEYGLDVELLTSEEVRRRYPVLRPLPDEVGVFEAAAGAVFPEMTVRAQLDVAQDAGAHLHFGTRVLDWDAGVDPVTIELENGAVAKARNLVLTVGPWFARTFDALGIRLQIERNVQFWFDPKVPGLFGPDRFLPFALERSGRFFYGFPDYGDGVKCAFHHTGIYTDPQHIDRTASQTELSETQGALAAFIPAAAGTYRASAACMYAMTPDHHFVIGRHPDFRNVFLAGGFSGHGFKFVPVIGEIMANFASTGAPGHEIGMFSPLRFLKPPSSSTKGSG